MNHNYIRTAVIGVTTGVTAGCVTVGAIIAWDTYDPWGTLQKAIARCRLSPAERQELRRLQDEKATRSAGLARVRDARIAATRAQFLPALLRLDHRVDVLEDLTVPALIVETERALQICQQSPVTSACWGHRNALLSEFDRRTGWDVKSHLSELDQMRLDAAERRIASAQFAPASPPPPTAAAPQPAALRTEYPDFTGPNDQPTQK